MADERLIIELGTDPEPYLRALRRMRQQTRQTADQMVDMVRSVVRRGVEGAGGAGAARQLAEELQRSAIVQRRILRGVAEDIARTRNRIEQIEQRHLDRMRRLQARQLEQLMRAEQRRRQAVRRAADELIRERERERRRTEQELKRLDAVLERRRVGFLPPRERLQAEANAQIAIVRRAVEQAIITEQEGAQRIAQIRQQLNERLRRTGALPFTGGLAAMQIAFGAIAFAAVRAGRAIVDFGRHVIDSVRNIDQLQSTLLEISAILVTFDRRELPAGLKFVEALQQGEQLLGEIVRINAQTVVGLEDTLRVFEAIIQAGVDARTALDLTPVLANTVAILTRGQGLERQLFTEIRALFEGTVTANARIAFMLEQQGINLKKMIPLWREQGVLAERLTEALSGFAIAGNRFAQTFQGLATTIQAELTLIQRRAFVDTSNVLQGFRDVLVELLELIRRHRDEITDALRTVGETVLTVTQSLVSMLRGLAELAPVALAPLKLAAGIIKALPREIVAFAAAAGAAATATLAFASALGVLAVAFRSVQAAAISAGVAIGTFRTVALGVIGGISVLAGLIAAFGVGLGRFRQASERSTRAILNQNTQLAAHLALLKQSKQGNEALRAATELLSPAQRAQIELLQTEAEKRRAVAKAINEQIAANRKLLGIRLAAQLARLRELESEIARQRELAQQAARRAEQAEPRAIATRSSGILALGPLRVPREAVAGQALEEFDRAQQALETLRREADATRRDIRELAAAFTPVGVEGRQAADRVIRALKESGAAATLTAEQVELLRQTLTASTQGAADRGIDAVLADVRQLTDAAKDAERIRERLRRGVSDPALRSALRAQLGELLDQIKQSRPAVAELAERLKEAGSEGVKTLIDALDALSGKQRVIRTVTDEVARLQQQINLAADALNGFLAGRDPRVADQRALLTRLRQVQQTIDAITRAGATLGIDTEERIREAFRRTGITDVRQATGAQLAQLLILLRQQNDELALQAQTLERIRRLGQERAQFAAETSVLEAQTFDTLVGIDERLRRIRQQRRVRTLENALAEAARVRDLVERLRAFGAPAFTITVPSEETLRRASQLERERITAALQAQRELLENAQKAFAEREDLERRLTLVTINQAALRRVAEIKAVNEAKQAHADALVKLAEAEGRFAAESQTLAERINAVLVVKQAEAIDQLTKLRIDLATATAEVSALRTGDALRVELERQRALLALEQERLSVEQRLVAERMRTGVIRREGELLAQRERELDLQRRINEAIREQNRLALELRDIVLLSPKERQVVLEEERARVLREQAEILREQVRIQTRLGDATIFLADVTRDMIRGLDAAFDDLISRLTRRLGIFGGVVRRILTDLARLVVRRVFGGILARIRDILLGRRRGQQAQNQTDAILTNVLAAERQQVNQLNVLGRTTESTLRTTESIRVLIQQVLGTLRELVAATGRVSGVGSAVRQAQQGSGGFLGQLIGLVSRVAGGGVGAGGGIGQFQVIGPQAGPIIDQLFNLQRIEAEQLKVQIAILRILLRSGGGVGSGGLISRLVGALSGILRPRPEPNLIPVLNAASQQGVRTGTQTAGQQAQGGLNLGAFLGRFGGLIGTIVGGILGGRIGRGLTGQIGALGGGILGGLLLTKGLAALFSPLGIVGAALLAVAGVAALIGRFTRRGREKRIAAASVEQMFANIREIINEVRFDIIGGDEARQQVMDQWNQWVNFLRENLKDQTVIRRSIQTQRPFFEEHLAWLEREIEAQKRRKALGQKARPEFAQGGPVVPILAESREMILPPESVQRIGADKLAQLNAVGPEGVPASIVRKVIEARPVVVPGVARGDTVPLVVPAGSFILRRSVAERLRLQGGGLAIDPQILLLLLQLLLLRRSGQPIDQIIQQLVPLLLPTLLEHVPRFQELDEQTQAALISSAAGPTAQILLALLAKQPIPATALGESLTAVTPLFPERIQPFVPLFAQALPLILEFIRNRRQQQQNMQLGGLTLKRMQGGGLLPRGIDPQLLLLLLLTLLSRGRIDPSLFALLLLLGQGGAQGGIPPELRQALAAFLQQSERFRSLPDPLEAAILQSIQTAQSVEDLRNIFLNPVLLATLLEGLPFFGRLGPVQQSLLLGLIPGILSAQERTPRAVLTSPAFLGGFFTALIKRGPLLEGLDEEQVAQILGLASAGFAPQGFDPQALVQLTGLLLPQTLQQFGVKEDLANLFGGLFPIVGQFLLSEQGRERFPVISQRFEQILPFLPVIEALLPFILQGIGRGLGNRRALLMLALLLGGVGLFRRRQIGEGGGPFGGRFAERFRRIRENPTQLAALLGVVLGGAFLFNRLRGGALQGSAEGAALLGLAAGGLRFGPLLLLLALIALARRFNLGDIFTNLRERFPVLFREGDLTDAMQARQEALEQIRQRLLERFAAQEERPPLAEALGQARGRIIDQFGGLTGGPEPPFGGQGLFGALREGTFPRALLLALPLLLFFLFRRFGRGQELQALAGMAGAGGMRGLLLLLMLLGGVGIFRALRRGREEGGGPFGGRFAEQFRRLRERPAELAALLGAVLGGGLLLGRFLGGGGDNRIPVRGLLAAGLLGALVSQFRRREGGPFGGRFARFFGGGEEEGQGGFLRQHPLLAPLLLVGGLLIGGGLLAGFRALGQLPAGAPGALRNLIFRNAFIRFFRRLFGLGRPSGITEIPFGGNVSGIVPTEPREPGDKFPPAPLPPLRGDVIGGGGVPPTLLGGGGALGGFPILGGGGGAAGVVPGLFAPGGGGGLESAAAQLVVKGSAVTVINIRVLAIAGDDFSEEVAQEVAPQVITRMETARRRQGGSLIR